MTPEQFSNGVITPVLQNMGMYSDPAHDLLLGTAIHESDSLKRVTQYGYEWLVPDQRLALGYFQMEPRTMWDLYDSYLNFRNDKRVMVESFKASGLSRMENLISNPAYATATARMHYYRDKREIPDNLEEQAKYWKRVWNTEYGKGTVEKYLQDIEPYKQLLRC